MKNSGLDVQCAKNPGSADKYIKGKISNVKNDNNQISYDIEADGTYGYKYSFKQKESGSNSFNLTEIEYISGKGKKVGYIHPDWNTRDYTFENEILNITGDPQVSANEGNNRKKLEEGKKASDLS